VSVAALQALERQWAMPTYARNPVEFVNGEGARLWDEEGNEYLDFLAGISVAQIGHAHPALVQAVADQAGRLMYVGNLYYSEPALRLAERLAKSSLGGKVFLTNSGAEAVECALKLARCRRRGGDVVVLEGAFHGRTFGALSATPQESKQEPFAPLVPGFRVVAKTTEAVTAAVDERTAAVLIEPIQGETGIHPIDTAVMRAARDACDAHGALLVFDEIQCGMGRTGEMWAWKHGEVRPDAMCVAKGLGGGLPIGACVTTPEHGDVLGPGDHGSTFAGGPVVCAAANAVMDVVDDPAFLEEVRAKGERLWRGIEGLNVERLRGTGLMVAFDLADAPEVARRLLLEQQLVVNATGPQTIRLLPPLTVNEGEIDEALARLEAVLASRR
jgi:acetylornithine/N-succinyldiaminopimelate aminotransferase